MKKHCLLVPKPHKYSPPASHSSLVFSHIMLKHPLCGCASQLVSGLMDLFSIRIAWLVFSVRLDRFMFSISYEAL